MRRPLLSLLAVLATACVPAGAPGGAPTPAAGASAAGWRLAWSDEFDRPGLPDPTRWNYEEGRIRNKELQYYTRRPENARVEGGNLVIEARREPYQGAEYTSASLTTQDRASWTYGRIEVRAKVPQGRGMWPAIWTLGINRREVGWPRTGELDIMEYVGFQPDTIHANVHTGDYNHRRGNERGGKIHVPQPYRDFHVYAVEWFPERVDFFVDDRKYLSVPNTGEGIGAWPFDAPQYLILNTAVGGTWGGQKGVDESIFPQRFLIDYVRVYQQAPR